MTCENCVLWCSLNFLPGNVLDSVWFIFIPSVQKENLALGVETMNVGLKRQELRRMRDVCFWARRPERFLHPCSYKQGVEDFNQGLFDMEEV